MGRDVNIPHDIGMTINLLLISSRERYSRYPGVYSTKNFTINSYPCYPGKFIYLNFHALEVVSRYGDPQLQESKNYSY